MGIAAIEAGHMFAAYAECGWRSPSYPRVHVIVCPVLRVLLL